MIAAFPNHNIKVTGHNARYTKQTIGLQFIVNRSQVEPGFRLDRTESNDRHVPVHDALLPGDAARTRYHGNGSVPEPDRHTAVAPPPGPLDWLRRRRGRVV